MSTIGNAAVKTEQHQAQAATFARAVRKHEIADSLRHAVKDHQNNEMDSAARGYQRILAVDPQNSQALNNLSLLLTDNRQAIHLLKKALEVAPGYVDALINLGVRYIASGELAEAEIALSRAVLLAPADARARGARTILADARGEETNKETYRPCYTVIIPTHYRPKLLERALASLKAQHSEIPLEIIIIADVADVETDTVCQKWLSSTDIYVRRNGKPGPSESRNLGLKLAHGDVILFLDDDDAWHPELLSRLSQNEVLKSGQAVYFNCIVAKERRTPAGPVSITEMEFNTRDILNEKIYVKNQVHMSCFAFPASVLRGLCFDVHMQAYEDWDFLLFVCDRQMPVHVDIFGSKIYEVDDETTDRRGSSRAAQDINAILDYLYVYRRHPVKPELRELRASLLASVGFPVPAEFI